MPFKNIRGIVVWARLFPAPSAMLLFTALALFESDAQIKVI